MSISKIEEIKKKFKDKKIIEEALTHRSWVNENKGEKRDNNERLEFLGDAILEFIVSKHLFFQFPKKNEGFLTTLRSNLVNTTGLASVARELDLGRHLYLSKGEEETGGRTNPSILADTVEAIIGAIYIDQGLENTEKFIEENILYKIKDLIKKPLKDPKSRLQEKIQAEGMPAPKYVVVKEMGPDHQKTFVVRVSINGELLEEGVGKSKSEAEQQAAQKALDKFDRDN